MIVISPKMRARRYASKTVSRRTALALMLSVGGNAHAQQKPTAENLAKVGAWLVGSKLGLSALVYFRRSGAWESGFDDAKGTAREIGIEIKPFPSQPPDAQSGLIKLLDFVGKGDGARVATDIRQKHGAYHAALFEVAVRMFHMPLLYDLDPMLADRIAEFIRTKFVAIGLPGPLWKPAVDAVAKRAGFQDVRAAVIQMNGDVRTQLINMARGQG